MICFRVFQVEVLEPPLVYHVIDEFVFGWVFKQSGLLQKFCRVDFSVEILRENSQDINDGDSFKFIQIRDEVPRAP